MKKIYTATALLLSLALVLCGCSGSPSENGGEGGTDALSSPVTGGDFAESGEPAYEIDVTDAFSNRDSKTEYDADTAVYVTLADGMSEAESKALADSVVIDGDTVTITDEGDYVISGSLTNGMIKIDAEKTDKVHLIFNGVTVHSASFAAVYVKTADKVFITLEKGSENALYTDGEFVTLDENDVDAVIFSKEDLTLNGEGKLTVITAEGHGIVSKDDLKLMGGAYVIETGGHGFSGKDRLYIRDGEYEITAGKDALHSENTDDETLGLLLIAGGKITAAAEGDGIHGGAAVQIDGGEVSIVAGGGFENGKTHSDGMGGMGGFGGMGSPWGDPSGSLGEDGASDGSVSRKGIKAAGKLLVNGGVLSINSADDGLHGGGDVTVTGGRLEIATGDDGIHSDAEVNVSGGLVNVTESYEGIEGTVITVNGGDVTVLASDDGMNASGGTSTGGMGGFGGFGGMMDGSDEYGINIAGGKLYVNADGDGIDSNGYIRVSGGETYVDGPTNSGNGALDYGTTATVSGGIFVAVGASGMAENFSSDSTQGAIMCSLTAFTSQKISLADEEGKELVSYTPQKQYSSVLVSTPDVKPDGTYVITVGTASLTVEMDGYVYGEGGMGPGGMGGGHGGGGRPGGRPGR